jgi:hypothetical protein
MRGERWTPRASSSVDMDSSRKALIGYASENLNGKAISRLLRWDLE